METILTKQDILDLLKEQSRVFQENLERERRESEQRRKEYEKELKEHEKELKERLERERLEREQSRKEHEKELKERFERERLEREQSRKEHEKEVKERLERERLEREQSRKESEKELSEYDEKLKKYNEEFYRKNREIQAKIDSLTGVWGKFVEGLVEPKIVDMFRERGIEIEMSAQQVKGFRDGETYYEIDLLLVNTRIAVVVEVKSSLSVRDVKNHLKRLERIKKVKPRLFNLSGATLYGAVAGMRIESDADKYAYRKGLYVLKQKGSIVEIVNDDKFQPKTWEVEY